MTNVTHPSPRRPERAGRRTAADRGTSLSNSSARPSSAGSGALSLSWSEDPLFADREVYEGPAPADGAERHDDYIYGDRIDLRRHRSLRRQVLQTRSASR